MERFRALGVGKPFGTLRTAGSAPLSGSSMDIGGRTCLETRELRTKCRKDPAPFDM